MSAVCASAAAVAAPMEILLEVKESSDNPTLSTTARAGLAALHEETIVIALRTALSIQGDVAQPLSSAVKSWLADHYINTRVTVDKHTAAAVMYEAFSTSKVLVVRNFPAAMKPTRQTVRDVIMDEIPSDNIRYLYNRSRSHVHALLMERYDGREDLQQQRHWWSTINLLPDTGNLDKLSGGTLWSAVSRRGKTLLHLDETDGVSWQWTGRKVWVFVNRDEAAAQEIKPSPMDSMRDETPGAVPFHSLAAVPIVPVADRERGRHPPPSRRLSACCLQHWRRRCGCFINLLSHRRNTRCTDGCSSATTTQEAH